MRILLSEFVNSAIVRASTFSILMIAAHCALLGCGRYSLEMVSTSTSTPIPTSIAPMPTPTPPVMRTLRNFAIYYGYPNSLNSTSNGNLGWDNTAVANFFKQYSLVVFGAGLEAATHPDHNNTKAITAGLNGTTLVYGYVAIGSTNSYTVNDLKQKIDAWKNLIGANGILIDEFGFDFRLAGATDADVRARQKEIVDYAHSLGLNVIVNAWDPDDVFTKESGNPLSWSPGDKYLFESYIFSSATRQTFAQYRTKVAKLQAAHSQTSVEIYTVSTTLAANSAFQQTDFDFMAASAAADGFHGVSWGTENFSASSAEMPYRTSANFIGNYTVDSSPIIDADGATVSFTHSSGRLLLDYSGATITPQ